MHPLRRAGLCQAGHAADAAHPFEPAVESDQPGRIVAAVFQPAQAFEQDGDDVTLRNRADNAAHA